MKKGRFVFSWQSRIWPRIESLWSYKMVSTVIALVWETCSALQSRAGQLLHSAVVKKQIADLPMDRISPRHRGVRVCERQGKIKPETTTDILCIPTYVPISAQDGSGIIRIGV